MLREITLREAVERIEKEETVWAVNLENEEKQLVDLRILFSGVRILADLPDAPQEKKARRAGRPKKEPQAEEIAVTIDCGKVGALRKAGWSVKDIAIEFGTTEETMKEVLKILDRK